MDGARLEALARTAGLAATASNIEREAKAGSPEAARWAFDQWALRKRARDKFEKAEEMLFTREALEQATHERLAWFHAIQFPEGALVADLTCGIGADLIALAKNGSTIGYETDPQRAEFARHNLTVHGLEAEIRVRDCLQDAWEFEYAFADPSRRSSGRRTLDPNEFSPNPLALAERMSGLSLGLMKLSPMLPDEFLESLGLRLEFISFGRECREAVVKTGTELHYPDGSHLDHVSRWALHVESGVWLPGADESAPVTDEPEEFLFEADPAAIRAHGLTNVCYAHGLSALGDSNGYLTGSREVSTPWLRNYHVLWAGKGDVGGIRRELAGVGAATPVLKQRATGLDLEALRKQFKPSGARELAVAFYPVGKSIRAAILEEVA